MILIVTASSREAALLSALCDNRSWASHTSLTLAGFIKLAEKNKPRVVVVRHRLSDGYSDDILGWCRTAPRSITPHVIVLLPADAPIRHEARQVALGADCVLRDPLRLEVLLEYIGRYRSAGRTAPGPANEPAPCYLFAGVRVVPHEHRLERSGRALEVTPQEIELLRVLHHSAGKVAPYPALYGELFNRRFDGNTANCRVLLAKTAASFAALKVDLRAHIKVIPKSGYLYSPETTQSTRPS